MSQDVRQSNLFAAEDYRKVYKSFKDVDFTAYDFDSLRGALIDYIRLHYPEDFNDYSESSEFVAIVELLAYLGTSLSFRVDLNSRENFMDTAERRESIIRLARMINYQPKRNVAAKGLFKLIGIETTEPVYDSQERNLNGLTVFWNDPNNQDSYDQFITIMNAAFSKGNPFGKPYKSGTIGGISTALYQLNNLKKYEVAYPIEIVVNDQSLPFDIVNTDFDDTLSFTERHPDPTDAFHIIYRNDGQGLDSSNTGFFVQFKQGRLQNTDNRFDFPIQNRVLDVNVTNINESDVWVQEISETGDVLSKWTKVPNVSGGTNVIYNSINLGIRDIFEVISRVNDQVSLKFSDGNFGTIPTGTFRTWYRTSANQSFILRPEEAQNLEISIPYIGRDNQQYSLRLIFSLYQTVSNSSPSETNEEIKNRAPQVYYTQDRMVNNEDYNVFPLTQGSSIAKIHAINRTHAGHSRYIDINDPTGFHQNLNIFSEDGAIYELKSAPSIDVSLADQLVEESTLVSTQINTFVKNHELQNFFFSKYIDEYKRYRQSETPDPNNPSVTRPAIPNIFKYTNSTRRYWEPYPTTQKNNTGFFSNVQAQNVGPYYVWSATGRLDGEFRFLNVGSKVKFTNGTEYKEATVTSIVNPVTSGDADNEAELIATQKNGTYFVLDIDIEREWYIDEVYPRFRTTFNTQEVAAIASEMVKLNEFGLKYDIDSDPNGAWVVILGVPSSNLSDAEFDLNLYQPTVRNDWVTIHSYISQLNSYRVYSRGVRYVFESYSDVQFFFDTDEADYDIYSGTAKRDEIEILPINSNPPMDEIWKYRGAGVWDLINGDIQINYLNNIIVLRNREILPTSIVYQRNGAIIPNAASISDISYGILNVQYPLSQIGDIIRISYPGEGALLNSVVWNSYKPFIEADGFTDTHKIEVIPADTDFDGIPDRIFNFEALVSPSDIVFHERYQDLDGYEYDRLWKTAWLDLRTQSTLDFTYTDAVDRKLTLITESQETSYKSMLRLKTIEAFWNNTFNNNVNVGGNNIFIERKESDGISIITQNIDSLHVIEKIYVNNGNNGTQNEILAISSLKETATDLNDFIALVSEYDILTFEIDQYHTVNLGRSFTLDTQKAYKPFHYKWKHYAPSDNRIDPSVSNIVDMVTLTQAYYDDIMIWKDKGQSISLLPSAPSTEDLRIQYSELNTYKMMSDQIIFQPAKFKILFGPQADEEYRATFKVVKVPTTLLTDNEIKSKVIDAIDKYFDIKNWDFGESFFYTELAAYIHQNLANIIGTVVIVPVSQRSKFGNLFQIKAESNELFISTATVSNVEIVNNLTETNLRI